MFIIAREDIPSVEMAVYKIINTLNDGAERVDKDVDIGDGLKPLRVSGYWVSDVMRIDIKIKK